MRRYESLYSIIRDVKPRTIIEVGTHRGHRAARMCEAALAWQSEPVHYTGFDLFEDATEETAVAEDNGKGAGSRAQAEELLKGVSARFGGRLTWELIQGNTRDTLHGKRHVADFVFVDGGHSVETIRGDFEAVKDSRVVAMDDYYVADEKGVCTDTARFGCNFIIDADPGRWDVLEVADKGWKGGRSKIAVRGWLRAKSGEVPDGLHADACREIMAKRACESYAEIEDGEPLPFSDFIYAPGLPAGADLAYIQSKTRKAAFLTLRLGEWTASQWHDALREARWLVDNEVELGDTLAVECRPLVEIQEVNTRGAGENDARLGNARVNVKLTPRRVFIPVSPHARRMVLACYGPSLAKTLVQLTDVLRDPLSDLVTCSGSHDFLIERGFMPRFHVESDPRPHKAKHHKRGYPEVDYLLASSCHPVMVKKLQKRGGKVTLWHSYEGEWSKELATTIDPGAPLVGGGGNVGLRALALFHSLGYRHFDVFGMDYNFADDGAQHAGAHAGKEQAEMEVSVGGRVFRSSALNVAYARQFGDMFQSLPETRWRIFGDGLLSAMMQAGGASTAKEAA